MCGRARICISIYVRGCMCALVPHPAPRVPPHLASVASSSSSQISGLWRRCRPGSRCTAPASCRGSFAAGGQSVGGRVAPSPVASAGSNRWRWPLPCLRRYSRHKNSPVSVRASGLFSCVHRRGRSAEKARHKPPLSAITAPYFRRNALKSKLNSHFTLQHIFCYRYSPGHLLTAHRGLPVRHVSPVCLSVRYQLLSLNGSSSRFYRTPFVSLRCHYQQTRQAGASDKERNASESNSAFCSEKRPFVFR